MNKKHVLILLLLILLASALRLYNPVFRSLWGDEGHSVFSAYDFIQQGLLKANTTLIKDSHLPVYFVSLAVWIKSFGAGEYVLRLFSVLIGILSVLIFYLFAKEVFEEKTALLSSFLLALSPMAIFYSQEIRMYGLMLLLSLLSSLYFWRLISKPRNPGNAAGYFVFTVLLVLTHVYAALFLIAQFIYLLFCLWKDKDWSFFYGLFLWQILIGVLAFPFYAKIAINSLPSFVSGTSDMAFSVFPWHLKSLLFFFVLSLGETVAPWNWLVVVPAGTIFGFLFIRTFKRINGRKTIFLLVLCLFPIVFSVLFLKLTVPKYLIIVLPFYLMLVGYSLLLIRLRSLRLLFFFLLTTFQVFALFNYFNLKEYHNSNQIEPWQKVVGLIKREYRSGDIVVASNRFVSYRLLQYYLNKFSGSEYPLFCLQKDIYTVSGLNQIRYNASRIWFVTQIADERAFPPGYIEGVRQKLAGAYRLISEQGFVPYEETLVAQLPIGRHKTGSVRIKIDLYERDK